MTLGLGDRLMVPLLVKDWLTVALKLACEAVKQALDEKEEVGQPLDEGDPE